MKILRNCFLLMGFFMIGHVSSAQLVKQNKMAQLAFMVGDWVGTSKTIKNDSVVSEIPAFQKIKYDLNKHIIVIDLRSESLQLHTVIYYDEKDQTYFYTPFSERGSGKLSAEFKDGKLIVNSSKTVRYVFSATKDGGFQEYGERLVDGKWMRYFEDNFINTQLKID